jgi:nucleoside diphosphate kinase
VINKIILYSILSLSLNHSTFAAELPSMQPKQADLSQESLDTPDVTVVVIKPGAIARGQAENILADLEKFCSHNKLTIFDTREIFLTKELLQTHYFGKSQENIKMAGQKLMNDLDRIGALDQFASYTPEEIGTMAYTTDIENYAGKSALGIIIIGKDATKKIAEIKGATNPVEALPNTLRGKYASNMSFAQVLTENKALDNAVHAPADKKEASKDLGTFFNTTKEEVLAKSTVVHCPL